MTIEVRPLGDLCNLKCSYCYEEGVREAKNVSAKYSMDKMLKRLEEVGTEFHLFGGEAFLVPREDRVKLWEFGYERYGKNGIMSNGTLITLQDIEDILKYNVGVGISIDGPNEMNDLRAVRTGGIDATRKATQKTMDNIRLMTKAGVSVGVIICLHKRNATKELLPRLLNFIDWLDKTGVKFGNIHTLEVEATMRDQDRDVLTQEENIYALKKLANFFQERPHLSFKPFTDMKEMLINREDSKTDCIWQFCDPRNTAGVYGIEGDGSLSNCGRASKDGINWYKTERYSYLRYIALYNTPEENGGCKGCRFWLVCGGQCPGEAINADFRNKSTNCATYKAMLTHYEDIIISNGEIPITKSPKLGEVEELMIEALQFGRRVGLYSLFKYAEEYPKTVLIEVRSDTDEIA